MSEGEANPVLRMTLNKCVLFICKTVPFNGTVTVVPTKGSCVRNADIDTDFASPAAQAVYYDGLQMSVCLDNQTDYVYFSIIDFGMLCPLAEAQMQAAIFHSLQLL